MVTSLAEFQAQDGGFSDDRQHGDEGELGATAAAATLSALYGLGNRVGVSARPTRRLR